MSSLSRDPIIFPKKNILNVFVLLHLFCAIKSDRQIKHQTWIFQREKIFLAYEKWIASNDILSMEYFQDKWFQREAAHFDYRSVENVAKRFHKWIPK